MLRIANLQKAYGGHQVLNDVSFEIGDREKVALVGPNGAGKSTLLKIVAGLIEADDGVVKLEGEHWSARAYGDGEVFQPGERVQVVEIRGAIALVTE